ncbi:MAG TPA: hypothetical protein VGM56_27155 [Byssovorax sp.]
MAWAALLREERHGEDDEGEHANGDVHDAHEGEQGHARTVRRRAEARLCRWSLEARDVAVTALDVEIVT